MLDPLILSNSSGRLMSLFSLFFGGGEDRPVIHVAFILLIVKLMSRFFHISIQKLYTFALVQHWLFHLNFLVVVAMCTRGFPPAVCFRI